jgi:hypothetical protein
MVNLGGSHSCDVFGVEKKLVTGEERKNEFINMNLY